MKSRPSMEKRRKEQARKERRQDKALRREQRNAERQQRRDSGDAPEMSETGKESETNGTPADDPTASL